MVRDHRPGQTEVFRHGVVCRDLVDRVAPPFGLGWIFLKVVANAVPAMDVVITGEPSFIVTIRECADGYGQCRDQHDRNTVDKPVNFFQHFGGPL